MIHVIGNSHVSLFSNLPYVSKDKSNHKIFRLHCLGAVTARYLYKIYWDKVLDILKDVDRDKDYIIIVAGEVDCRFNIPVYANKNKLSDRQVTYEFLSEYLVVFDELVKLGYKVISFGVHPSVIKKHNISDLNKPVFGGLQRRDGITRLWNNRLRLELEKRNIPYLCIYDYVKSQKKIKQYYIDYCHIDSTKIFNYIIQELNKIIDEKI